MARAALVGSWCLFLCAVAADAIGAGAAEAGAADEIGRGGAGRRLAANDTNETTMTPTLAPHLEPTAVPTVAPTTTSKKKSNRGPLRFRPTRIAQSIALVVVSGCFACAFLYKFDKPDAHYREERAREEAEWQAEHKGETYE
mmetsp:Transcript_32288/g.99897  ORF Transcript_32288/g.99897 Transcript_32288/m.99897 type:complete len:142 (-) Transcript_32288:43-468(-)